jgi:hypothetical protein
MAHSPYFLCSLLSFTCTTLFRINLVNYIHQYIFYPTDTCKDLNFNSEVFQRPQCSGFLLGLQEDPINILGIQHYYSYPPPPTAQAPLSFNSFVALLHCGLNTYRLYSIKFGDDGRIGRDMRGSGSGMIDTYPRNCLEGMRNATETSVRSAGVSVKIRTQYLQTLKLQQPVQPLLDKIAKLKLGKQGVRESAGRSKGKAG